VNVSTKARYAIRALVDLAELQGEGPKAVRDISARQDISNLYLVRLLGRLKKAGLVRSVRGARGGYELAKSPSDIPVIEILQVMEGSTASVDCVDNALLCSRSGTCSARKLWMKIKGATDEILSNTTLADLVAWQREETGPPEGGIRDRK